jgi:hypothetical protein
MLMFLISDESTHFIAERKPNPKHSGKPNSEYWNISVLNLEGLKQGSESLHPSSLCYARTVFKEIIFNYTEYNVFANIYVY